MSNSHSPNPHLVGNDFGGSRPKTVTLKIPIQQTQVAEAAVVVNHASAPPALITPSLSTPAQPYLKHRIYDYLHEHSIVVFACLLLAIGAVGLPILSRVLSPNLSIGTSRADLTGRTSGIGLNKELTAAQFQSWQQTFDDQPATLNLGSQTVNISPQVINSWLKVTPNAAKTEYAVHVNSAFIGPSLINTVNKYVHSPVNQVTATRSDGSSEVAVAGQNGTQLSNPSAILAQAQNIGRNLLNNKGFNVSAPLVSKPYVNVTPSSFGKLLLVDVNSKKMYAYQNGQIVNTFLVSAGAPATPTPIGEFHIYAKYAVQNMSGFNPNGTPYFQPNVEWVNYFDGGDAVHGVYWHPLSWFGVHNSSHGCVGIPDNEAEWVYNWAPIGTTVITTPN